jgi:hypothetical protein
MHIASPSTLLLSMLIEWAIGYIGHNAAVLTGNHLKSKSPTTIPTILKDVTLGYITKQGPVQLYARRLWPFLRMSLGYITKQGPVQLYARRLWPFLRISLGYITKQGPVQLYARRLWPFLRMSLGYIMKVLYNSTRDDYSHSEGCH